MISRPGDAGLQPQRTSLAWTRTLLSLLIITLLVWRAWLNSNGTLLLISAIAASISSAVFAALSWYRAAVLRTHTHAAPTWTALGVSVTLVVLASSIIIAVIA